MLEKNNIESEIVALPLDQLRPFKNHAFKLYVNEQLQKLTESVMQNGVVQPIIVRPIQNEDNFEIISGHNRAKAAKKAGLTEIPAYVRRELSDDEATIMANITNIQQRSFNDWLPSEKAESIAQYHKAIKRQGKRSDRGGESSVQLGHKFNARAETAKIYGLKDSAVERFVQVNNLIKQLKARLDAKDFGFMPAYNLSFIPEAGQKVIGAILAKDTEKAYKVTLKRSEKLRTLLENCKDISSEVEDEIRRILSGENDGNDNPVKSNVDSFTTISISNAQYTELFADKAVDDVVSEIIAAVMHFRDNVSQTSHERTTKDEYDVAQINSDHSPAAAPAVEVGEQTIYNN